MRTIQQAVTWSTVPIAGTAILLAVLWQRDPGLESETPPTPDVASVEVPALTESFQVSVRDPAPPPPSNCSLEGRPGSLARKKAAAAWFRELSSRDRQIANSICADESTDPCLGFMSSPAMMTAEDQRALARAEEELFRENRRFVRRQLARLPETDRGCVLDYCATQRPRFCDTPLVVAFDSQPIAFAAGGATFAFQPGIPVATDWPTAVTPWIAIDLDRDGAITSGAELFGDATRLPDGSTASNGFEALAALDANRDGVIDRLDPAFGSLLLWADRDADRASTPEELRPLAEVVTAIPLANRRTPRCDARGNCEGERGSLRWLDDSGTPRIGAVVDVYLPRR